MAAEIAGWVEKKTGPEAVILEDAEKVKEFIADMDVAVVGFFKDQESEKAKQYRAAIRDYENYPVGITSDEKAFEENQVWSNEIRKYQSNLLNQRSNSRPRTVK